MAWVGDAVVPREEARVPIDDFGFRYGAACFETMLARHGRVFRLEAHLDRLERGLTGLRSTPPGRDLLRRAVAETLAANALAEASVRLTVTAGSGMLDRAGRISEAATANVFIMQGERLLTPSLESGPLPGVTRAVVLEIARREGVLVVEADVTPSDLARAAAVFLTSSVAGLRPVALIEGSPPACDPITWRAPERTHPLVERLQKAYDALVEQECAGG
jgi:branched-chain amino acid aminotransferase